MCGCDRGVQGVLVVGVWDVYVGEEMPVFDEREGFAGVDYGARAEEFELLEGAFGVGLGVDAVVGVVCAVEVREALDEQHVLGEVGAPVLLVAQADLLRVGLGGVAAEQDVLHAQGEARVLQIGERVQCERLRYGDVVVVGAERDAREDGAAGLDDADGPGGDVDGPQVAAGDGLLEVDVRA